MVKKFHHKLKVPRLKVRTTESKLLINMGDFLFQMLTTSKRIGVDVPLSISEKMKDSKEPQKAKKPKSQTPRTYRRST